MVLRREREALSPEGEEVGRTRGASQTAAVAPGTGSAWTGGAGAAGDDAAPGCSQQPIRESVRHGAGAGVSELAAAIAGQQSGPAAIAAALPPA